jgi:hypothetical protein
MTKLEKIKNIDQILINMNNFWLSTKTSLCYKIIDLEKEKRICKKTITSIIEFIENLEFFKEYFVNNSRNIISVKDDCEHDLEFWITRDLKNLLYLIDHTESGNIGHTLVSISDHVRCINNNLRLFKEVLE